MRVFLVGLLIVGLGTAAYTDTCCAAGARPACAAGNKPACCAAKAQSACAVAVKEPTALFNGQDFSGWVLFLPDKSADPTRVWTVKDGIIHCTGSPAGYLRTEKKYANYRLRVEWRWPEGGGNSGVLLHIQDVDEVWPKSIEAQLHSGDAGDFWVIGGTDFVEHGGAVNRRVVKAEDSTENPVGEWNTYQIDCRGDKIIAYVNGVLQNVATRPTVNEGYIGLQSEGTPVEFRKVTVEPLE